MNGEGVLIIGYGNSLRGDDGVGWHTALHLGDLPELAAADVRVCHQLTPELAEDVSTAALVVLIDARAGAVPGSILVQRVEPDVRPAEVWSHQMHPGALVHLAHQLYGAAPRVLLLSVGAQNLADGTDLSAAARRALPRVVDTVLDLVGDHAQAVSRSSRASRSPSPRSPAGGSDGGEGSRLPDR